MGIEQYFAVDIEPQAMVIRPLCAADMFAAETSRQHWKVLQDQIEQLGKPVVVDLDGLDHFGSTILDWIATTGKTARKCGLGMSICSVAPTALDLLKIARFDQLWPLHDSRSEALQESSQ